MVNNFPNPMPDETLHSILARYYMSSIYVYWRNMAQDMFDRIWVYSVASIPVGLEKLIEAIEFTGLTFEKVLYEHTFFPYYTVFLSEERNRNMLNLARSCEKKEDMIRLGAVIRQNETAKQLRFCPKCALEDFRRNGFTFWRRSHQLPGVWICTKHGCSLFASKTQNDLFSNDNFNAAEVKTLFPASVAAQLSCHEKLLAVEIARGQEYVLKNFNLVRQKLLIPPEKLQCIIDGELHERRFVSVGGHVSYCRFQREFLEFYGENILRQTGLYLNAVGLTWIKDFYLKQLIPINALKVVLLGIFFAGSFQEFLERF